MRLPVGRVRSLVAASLVALVLAGACSDGESGTSGSETTATTAATSTTEAVEPTSYATRGPHPVGQLDLQLDPEHRVAVFYPAADPVPDAAQPYSYSGLEIFGEELAGVLPAAFREPQEVPDTHVEVPASDEGPFPVVLHSHGFSGYFRFAGLHNSHLASWGYVVASVDHPERGLLAALGGGLDAYDAGLDVEQLLAALELLEEQSTTSGSVLEGTVDSEQVATEGHSAGGSAAGAAAYDERVDTWIGQAPGPPVRGDALSEGFEELDLQSYLEANEPPPVPSMQIAADDDAIIALAEIEQWFGWLDPPKRLVVMENAGHDAFTDVCATIQDEGGLRETITALGLDPDEVPIVRLGEDGCTDENGPVEAGYEVIDHLTVAQLNWVFDIDRPVAAASLEQEWIDEQFPGLVERIESVGG